eukprot:GHUV01019240.1.p1 GENE.GHUV01019240.1~~GHUV01019240.1.p1  ORF type:complete len:322 (+),score=18.99 GHUV01019240.1:744-1709(+)
MFFLTTNGLHDLRSWTCTPDFIAALGPRGRNSCPPEHRPDVAAYSCVHCRAGGISLKHHCTQRYEGWCCPCVGYVVLCIVHQFKNRRAGQQLVCSLCMLHLLPPLLPTPQVPDGVTDEESILLGDILSTAFFCVDQGGVSAGDTVVVIGCGPVGLLAVLASRQRGASQVVAVDSVPSRRKKAAEFGAVSIDIPDAAAAIAAATDSRGADVALELVGSVAALKLGFNLLRPAGVLSSIGVHTEAQFPFSPVQAYDKNLTYKSGRCPARHYMEKLLPLVLNKEWPFTDIITHRVPLRQGAEAYQMFDKKLYGCIKVVLDPWAG